MVKETHLFITEMQSAKEFNFKVDAHSLLIDLKVLLKEYYAATFSEDGNSLAIAFNNGQKFLLSITEI